MEKPENTMLKLSPPNAATASPSSSASVTPSAPPMRQTSTASMRNCLRMSPWRAPTAMRTPISCVRSVTDTSMMFITPMPPTTSEMTAMAEISSVMVRVVLSTVWRMVSELRVKKSCVPWRCTMSSVMPVSAAPGSAASSTRTVMLRRCRVPMSRFITVV